MDEEKLNISIRVFLKKVGMKSQQEIEQSVARALKNKKLKGNESLAVSMTLKIDQTDLEIKFEDVISLG